MDWANEDHAVSIVNGRGLEVARKTAEHTAAGLRAMVKFLGKHGVGEVAIERGYGPVVDALLEAGLTVVVISPNRLKNLRSRYGSAGNKDDRFDAYVLADTLRTDRTRLRPLTHDSEATKTLRATVRARRDLGGSTCHKIRPPRFRGIAASPTGELSRTATAADKLPTNTSEALPPFPAKGPLTCGFTL